MSFVGDLDSGSNFSRGGGGDVSKSLVIDLKELEFGRVKGIRPSSAEVAVVPPAIGVVFEVLFAVGGRSSSTVDCLFRLSSSSSSAISINLRRRKELVDELVDPEAVCREHAADSVVSRNSLAVLMAKSVS
jgi:hypothetical protein